MPLPSEEEMRAEFHQLCKERDAIIAKAAPHRAKYDSARARLIEMELKEVKPHEVATKQAEAQLFQTNQKIAQLSRALGGRTGEAPKSN